MKKTKLEQYNKKSILEKVVKAIKSGNIDEYSENPKETKKILTEFVEEKSKERIKVLMDELKKRDEQIKSMKKKIEVYQELHRSYDITQEILEKRYNKCKEDCMLKDQLIISLKNNDVKKQPIITKNE